MAAFGGKAAVQISESGVKRMSAIGHKRTDATQKETRLSGFPNPIRRGDTSHVAGEILMAMESRARPADSVAVW
jgi:hypothetical protein